MAYSPEDVETALSYLAMAAGSSRAAIKRMEEDGHKAPPKATLDGWRNKVHAARYHEIARELEDKRRHQTAERLDQLQQRELDLLERTLDRYEEALDNDELPAKDVTRSLRDLSLSLGIKTDKSNVLRDRPSAITRSVGGHEEIRLLEELKRELAALEAVDGTAEEDDPPELLSG
jgi:hypothetical protein